MRINLLVHNRALFAGELAAECKDVSIDAAIQREMLQKKQPVKQCKAAESKPVNLEDSTVCSYACIYTCMHACMHTYIHNTYIRTYIHTYEHMYVTYMRTYVHKCMEVHVACVYMHVSEMHIYVYLCMHMCIRACICLCIHLCMHASINALSRCGESWKASASISGG